MNVVLDRLADERTQQLEIVDQLCHGAEGDERDLTSSELELVARAQGRIGEIDAQIGPLGEIETLRAASGAAHAGRTRSAAAAPPAGPLTTTGDSSEPVVYRTFAEYARDELIRRFDQVAAHAGLGARDAATERLTRAVAQITTATVPGLVPAQHLSQIIDVINAQRPIVQLSRQVPLTSGKLTYPKIVTRPIVGVQAAEKTEVASGPMQVDMITATAKTFAGAGNLSWQTINWSTPDALTLWFQLMAEDYAKKTDNDAADLLETTTQTDAVASGSLADYLAAITGAAATIYAATGRTANAIVAGATAGYGLLSLVSQTQPVFLNAGSINLSTRTGNVAGMTFIIDNNITSDVAIVGDFSALLCAETGGAPVELRAVEPSIAGMEVGVIGAFLAEMVEPDAFVKLTAPPTVP